MNLNDCDGPIVLWAPPAARPAASDIRTALTDALRRLGATVITSASAPVHADAALVHTGTPGSDTAALCRHHQHRFPDLPLLLLGRFPTEADRIVALESGADDCLGPECSARELLARVRALRRRLGQASQPSARATEGTTSAGAVRVGAWLYNRHGRSLTAGDRYAALSTVEASLLDALTAVPGRPVDREALLRRWTQAGQSLTLRAVDTAVMRLRKRVEPEPARPRWILTVRGQGYCYVSAEPW